MLLGSSREKKSCFIRMVHGFVCRFQNFGLHWRLFHNSPLIITVNLFITCLSFNQFVESLLFLKHINPVPLSSVTGTPRWAALSSLPQKAVRTPLVVAERCGLASTSLSGLLFGKWCSTSMVILTWIVRTLLEYTGVPMNLISACLFCLQFQPLHSTKPSL